MFGRRRSASTGPTDTEGEPLSNAGVVEAMKNVSEDDRPETRAMLFQLLLDTTLLVVTPAVPKRSGERTLRAAEHLNLVTLKDDEGSVLPVFTSVEAVSKWLTDSAGYIAVPSRALFELVATSDTNRVLIDPGSPTWGSVTRYEIEQLARGRLPLGKAGDVVAESTEVRIGKPATPPPPSALDALRTQLAQVPSVLRAWYFMMQQGQQAPELMIAIQYAAGVSLGAGLMRQIIDGAGDTSPTSATSPSWLQTRNCSPLWPTVAANCSTDRISNPSRCPLIVRPQVGPQTDASARSLEFSG
jgi:SseB protein N-terminal domain/SseB protein C-terminal domain